MRAQLQRAVTTRIVRPHCVLFLQMHRKTIRQAWYYQLAPSVLLGVMLLSSQHSSADEMQEEAFMGEEATREVTQAKLVEPVERSRDYLAGKLVGFASYIDHFFGGDRNYQESNQSVLQLDITRSIGRGAEQRFVLDGRAKLHLPNMEKRLHLVLETNPEKIATGEQQAVSPVSRSTEAEQDSIAAAARIEKSEEKLWHASADAGLQFKGLATNLFARARGRFEVPLDKWNFKAAETFFWFPATGTGATTTLDLERHIDEPQLFRASTNATWLMKTGNFNLRQDISLFHTLNERAALLYQLSAIGVSKPQMLVNEYILLLAYRYQLSHEWVYAELSPQLHYPKIENYRIHPMLVLRLELLFDESR